MGILTKSLTNRWRKIKNDGTKPFFGFCQERVPDSAESLFSAARRVLKKSEILFKCMEDAYFFLCVPTAWGQARAPAAHLLRVLQQAASGWGTPAKSLTIR